MSDKIYIHYGSDTFKPELIHGPHNDTWNKPKHALWASDENAEYGWIDWCIHNDYGNIPEDPHFRFKLKSYAKIFYVDSLGKESELPKWGSHFSMKFYDFDKLKSEGYDAVEVNISACDDLYMQMYGWDCDSIAILNPEVVEIV